MMNCTRELKDISMTAKALRVFLASLLTLALIPTAALADDGDSNEARASYEPEGYHDEGAGEPG